MAEGDEDKTAFFAGEGVFCYRKMPFGLKNTRATYQRLVDKVFHDQIMRNLKAYVNDMVIKSTSEEEMLADIKETFKKFRLINMKLNPKKCSFGIEECPFLGHLVTSLNGKIAALSRFLSNGTERSLPFFKVLKSCTDKKNIQWTQEAKAALQEMKKFVEMLPTLTAPIQGEVLIIVLQGAKLNYPGLEKLILALVHAARMLRRYFQAHTAIELGEHDIAFQKRGDETPKDFLMEVPPKDNRKEIEGRPDTKASTTIRLTTSEGIKIKKADALSKLASMTFEHLTKEVLVKVLSKKSIEEKEILQFETKEGKSWMTPIYEYLVSGLLPEDPKESRKIKVKEPQYKLIRGSLY
ncbi:reverse transcriptase domain-containing protein [Tanacetum coccineum]